MNIAEIRLAYSQAITDKTFSQLHKNLEVAEVTDTDRPVWMAYLATTEANLAKDAWLPTAKLGHLNKAMELFKQAIDAAGTDPEIRMLRILVDQAVPAFLGYPNHGMADKAIILNNLNLIPAKNLDAALFENIVNYLEKTGLFNLEEMEALKGAYNNALA